MARPAGQVVLAVPVAGFISSRAIAVEQMNLTEEQQKQIAELEKEIKAKLYKILTAEQQKILEEARPPQGGPGGPGGPGGGHASRVTDRVADRAGSPAANRAGSPAANRAGSPANRAEPPRREAARS